jgi:hypothetical protein
MVCLDINQEWKSVMRKPKAHIEPASKEWPGDLGKPIVIPFRMTSNPEDQHRPTIHLDGLTETLHKLMRLADHYGIKREGDAGWGLLLAVQIARDLHPGFQLVYDDLRATLLNRRCGTNLPTVEGLHPHPRPKGTGWAPDFPPETIALFADSFGKKLGWTDKKFCELIAYSVEPRLEKRGQLTERNKKVATLIRRLSQGRRCKKALATK